MTSAASNSISEFKPGKWGKIAPPSLPEAHIKLDPRLALLGENAILRFVMFASGRRPAHAGDWKRIWIGRLKFGFAGGGLFFIVNFGQSLARGIGQFYIGSPIFWVLVTVLAILSLVTGAYHYLNHTRTLFSILEKRLMELRAVPITAEDYALAHWGGYLLLDPYWRKIPATALWTACYEIEGRLSELTGWSYYPSTFGLKFNDILERDGARDHKLLHKQLRQQLGVSESTFSYSTRLDYLIALWREYLEVWWPNQPGEGEARRATLPSRLQNKPPAKPVSLRTDRVS